MNRINRLCGLSSNTVVKRMTITHSISVLICIDLYDVRKDCMLLHPDVQWERINVIA